MQPDKVENIVKACCILHNLLRSKNENTNITVDSDNNLGNWRQFPTEGLRNIPQTPTRPAADAVQTRDDFKDYFNGPGAVTWQEDMI